MGQTAISWTSTVLPDGTVLPGYSFNPWIGCTKVSEGCKLCYAERQNGFYNWNPAGWGPGKPRQRTSAANWKQPFLWAKKAKEDGVRRRVFCASLADVFDHEVPQAWRDDLFSLIDLGAEEYNSLDWLLLTKRPNEAMQYLPTRWIADPPDYIRIGITAENQPNLEKRWRTLFRFWHGKNFISYEPAIGPLDISRSIVIPDWDICGGESGAGCRPLDIAWARAIRDQCQTVGIAFFMKQLGGHPNKRHDPADWPEDLRIQQFPE